jgi:uncharacterized protein (DUF305 family)
VRVENVTGTAPPPASWAAARARGWCGLIRHRVPNPSRFDHEQDTKQMNTRTRHALMTAVTAAALALAGCGGSGGSGGADHNMPGMSSSSTSSGSASPEKATHNQADVTFATNMIPHHQQAVEMAEMASKQATNPEVKALATDIKAAQDPEIQTMSLWLTGWGQPVPTPMAGHDMSQMDGMMSAQDMQQLQTARVAQFDRMWLQMMTQHHQGAVTMATTETQQGQNADARVLAQQIITAQNKEIATMAQLLRTITG